MRAKAILSGDTRVFERRFYPVTHINFLLFLKSPLLPLPSAIVAFRDDYYENIEDIDRDDCNNENKSHAAGLRGEGRTEQKNSPDIEQEKEEGIQLSQEIVKFGEEGLLGNKDPEEKDRSHNHNWQLKER